MRIQTISAEVRLKGVPKNCALRAASICALTAILVSLALTAPAHAIWLPWASEQDKVKKCVDDVWIALLRGERGSLERNLVTGPSTKVFIDQELEYIRKFRVVKFYFRFRTIKVDMVKNEWAWVVMDKIALQANGARQNTSTVMVFKRENDLWKLYANPKTVKKRREDKLADKGPEPIESPASANKSPSGDRGFSWVKGPSPGAPSNSTDDQSARSVEERKTKNNKKFQARKTDRNQRDKKEKSKALKQTGATGQTGKFQWVKDPLDRSVETNNTGTKLTSPSKKESASSAKSFNGWTVEKGATPALP